MYKKAIATFARRGYICNKSGDAIQPLLDYCIGNQIPLVIVSRVSILALEVIPGRKTPKDLYRAG